MSLGVHVYYCFKQNKTADLWHQYAWMGHLLLMWWWNDIQGMQSCFIFLNSYVRKANHGTPFIRNSRLQIRQWKRIIVKGFKYVWFYRFSFLCQYQSQLKIKTKLPTTPQSGAFPKKRGLLEMTWNMRKINSPSS